MHQCEAMWISFLLRGAATEASYAVKVSAGGVNAITGTLRNARTEGRQDYLAVTPGDFSQTCASGVFISAGFACSLPIFVLCRWLVSVKVVEAALSC